VGAEEAEGAVEGRVGGYICVCADPGEADGIEGGNFGRDFEAGDSLAGTGAGGVGVGLAADLKGDLETRLFCFRCL
jgi:hypothetical protein